ncbi:MAG: hypothetical protein ACI8S6_006002 [Myxococcota bacterium]|jgi:hypothetical protein
MSACCAGLNHSASRGSDGVGGGAGAGAGASTSTGGAGSGVEEVEVQARAIESSSMPGLPGEEGADCSALLVAVEDEGDVDLFVFEGGDVGGRVAIALGDDHRVVSDVDCEGHWLRGLFGAVVVAVGGLIDDLHHGDLIGVFDLDGETSDIIGGTDCDDSDPGPGANVPEVCDGLDQNCDGVADDGVTTTCYADYDQDGYGYDTNSVEGCDQPDLFVTTVGDCDDSDNDTYEGAVEICGDEEDNNCNGEADEDCTVLDTGDPIDDDEDTGEGEDTDKGCSAIGTALGAPWLLSLLVIGLRHRE